MQEDKNITKFNLPEILGEYRFNHQIKNWFDIKSKRKYYLNKYKDNKSLCESINKIEVDGNDKYSWIKNVPMIELDGRKMISKITEDLIKLLSK